MHHNEIHNISANLLREVCSSTCIEPSLQTLSGQSFDLHTANTEDGAQVDIKAEGFWTVAQGAFYDIKAIPP